MSDSVNIGAESVYDSSGCPIGGLEEKTFWSINIEEAELKNATNIVGYYMRMIRSYLSSFSGLENIQVKPAINKNLAEDYGGPVVVVQRGQLSPANVGILNSNRLSETGMISSENFEAMYPEASFEDSRVTTELMNMMVTVTVFGMSHAETERISMLVFNLIHATSYDILKKTFGFIVSVNPPIVSQVGVEEKHSEIYSCQLAWSVDYKDDSVLLIRKNLIKYATIMVREQDENRTKIVSSQT